MTHSDGAPRTDRLRTIAFGAPADRVMEIVREDGGVILGNAISAEQVAAINAEIETAFVETRCGTLKEEEELRAFHGVRTKRLTNVILHSRTYREAFVDSDVMHSYATAMFAGVSQSFWLNACQAIEIHPGEKAQPLHRDMGNYPVFYRFGAAGPEVMMNLLLALCDVTEEIGATRVIPGSHAWDFDRKYTPEMTVPAEMKAGSALLIGGKVVHGGGANRTADVRRRVVATTFAPGFLVPEDAYPFVIPIQAARAMSPRLQQMLGFRSFHQTDPLGGSLWQAQFEELALHLEL